MNHNITNETRLLAVFSVSKQLFEVLGIELDCDEIHLGQGLNPSQRQAVAAAASRRLTLIQGPPGTGKTRCSIAILATWVDQMALRCQPNEKVLATSGSNIAVDNLVEGLAAAGVHVLRLGRPESIRPELTRHCLDFIVQGGVG